MILTVDGPSGSTISLDVTEKLGERVELDGFHVVNTAPTEFRVVRDGEPISEWRVGDNEFHDLQRNSRELWQERGTGWCFVEKPHRTDVMTFGVLSKGLALETRGMPANLTVLVWPRQGTYPETGSCGS